MWKGGQVKIMRPIQHIYPFEVHSPLESTVKGTPPITEDTVAEQSDSCRPCSTRLLYMQETGLYVVSTLLNRGSVLDFTIIVQATYCVLLYYCYYVSMFN